MKTRIFSLLVLTLGFMACSDDNIQQSLLPELSIEGTSGIINLQLPPVNDKPQKQATPIIVRNTGQAELQVTKLEWIAKPDRLDVIGKRGEACTQDDECGEGICLSLTCVSLGFKELPIAIEPGLRFDLELVISQGSGELNCPAAGPSVPTEYQASYCGELVIHTNAMNTTGIITDGKATIYMIRPTSSGQIEITPDFIEFQLVQPGSQQSRDFSIRNNGSEPLNIEQIAMGAKADFFRIAGDTPPLEIEPGKSQSWTLTVDVPATAEASQYEGFTELIVVSSAVNASSGRVPVQVSADAGSAPHITLGSLGSKTLAFDTNASQTLTVNNEGDATLQITSLLVTPNSARQFYTFEIDGSDVTNNFQTVNVAKNSSKDIKVTFNRPAGVTSSAVATLQLNHNDRASNSRSEVTLLGDAGDVPIARIYPQGFTFQAAVGETDTRTFVIRNVGTADLVISDATLNFTVGDISGSEFQVSGHLGTIPPGEFRAGTVTFTGTNTDEDIGAVIFASNDPMAMLDLGVKDVNSASPEVNAVITPASNNDGVVNRVSSFSATDSTPADIAIGALWTLVSKPAASTNFFFTTGPELQFVPDQAGEYRFVMLLNKQLRESEASFTLTVVP